MRTSRSDILKAGLSALYLTRAHRLLAPYARGIGLIFMLHRVRPATDADFAPNRILEVTPEFLDAVLSQVRAHGLDIVSLDETRERILVGEAGRPFACFTLDDGYRDNRDYAYPIFRRHGAPFAVYVPAAFPSGEGELWWVALEAVVRDNVVLEVTLDGVRERLATRTPSEKWATFARLYRWLRAAREERQRAFVRELGERYGVSLAAICRELIMSWDEVRALARDPLVTIGAHTVGHFALAKLSPEAAREELERGAERLEAELGTRPRHVSYPYGDAASAGARDFALAAEAGYLTGVTTRKGVLFPQHRNHLLALPRVSLNGDYQSLKFTELFLSGVPFALASGFRRVDAA